MPLPRWSLLLTPFLFGACKTKPVQDTPTEIEDHYLYLEEVESPKALDFAKGENTKTLEHLKSLSSYPVLESELRKVILAKDRMPGVYLKNGELYNFWQDDKNVRGLWRKTTIHSYKSANPEWEVILDLDELAKNENENWVWKGASTLPPHHEKALMYLSRGGKDATVVREFDMKTKQFVNDGFVIPEAKTNAAWKDENSIFVGTDFGPDSLTTSGYPRIVKLWKRGTPLSSATIAHEGTATDMSIYTYLIHAAEGHYIIHSKRISFYEVQTWYEDDNGIKTLLPVPKDAEFHSVFKKNFMFVLRSDWGKFKTGSVIALPLKDIGKGEKAVDYVQVVFAPTEKTFFSNGSSTKNHLFLQILDNVLAKIVRIEFQEPDKWIMHPVELGAKEGMAYIDSTEDESDTYLAHYVDFLTPTSVFVGNAEDKKNKFEKLKQSPERFNSKGLKTERFEALSADGTKIPYFVVGKENLKKDGKNPTLLYGYGGFEYAMQPSYLSVIGKPWLERGGVYVLSNLRGGGEFGPAWHQAVLKENRYKVYQDFIAIAEDLIKRKITSPQHLGIRGGSNGGLLVGATFTLRPDLFNAVICQVPLLDMLRYHKLLAGASWMGEYGDPEDPKMRQAILKYSPYQRVKPDMKYPEVFFMTSTKDDRVHPGHARKMVAKMKDQGHSVLYYENMEGGHAGNANLEQSILWHSLELSYLWDKLGNFKP